MKSKQERLMEVYNYVRENCNVHTKTEFAAYLHMTQPALSAAINGHEAYLTKNLFIKISSAFPGVFNLNYLLTGQGTLLANTDQIASEPQPQQTHALDMSYAIEKVIGRSKVRCAIKKRSSPFSAPASKNSRRSSPPPHAHSPATPHTASPNMPKGSANVLPPRKNSQTNPPQSL